LHLALRVLRVPFNGVVSEDHEVFLRLRAEDVLLDSVEIRNELEEGVQQVELEHLHLYVLGAVLKDVETGKQGILMKLNGDLELEDVEERLKIDAFREDLEPVGLA